MAEKDKEYAEWWDSLAQNYESKVLSPLDPSVKNPIFSFVSRLDFKNYKRVVDLGCGTGQFLPFLSKYFEEVWGFEQSENMLRLAKKRIQGTKNVYFKRLDIRNLKTYYGYFDIAFTINTIAPYDISLAEDIVKAIFLAIRKDGLFVGIIPSFDTILYLRELTFANYIEKELSDKESREKTDEHFIKQNKMDIEKGTYAEDGLHIQKFFNESEIHSLLRDAGFKDVTTEKVLYPWRLSKKHGYGYFPDKPEIWDWFFSAHK